MDEEQHGKASAALMSIAGVLLAYGAAALNTSFWTGIVAIILSVGIFAYKEGVLDGQVS